jgi:CubicO group peptidase (beta-lactamase class C family)
MKHHPTPMGGTCSARFDPLRELFASKLESGKDLGASVAVNIAGQRLGQFIAARVAGPLGADFHIGLPPSEFHRVANVVPPPFPCNPPQPDPDSVAFKTMTNPTMSAETTWTEGYSLGQVLGQRDVAIEGALPIHATDESQDAEDDD